MLDSGARATKIDQKLLWKFLMYEPIEITAYGGAAIKVGRLAEFKKFGKICVLPGPSLPCFADVKELYMAAGYNRGLKVTGDSGRVYNFEIMIDKTHATIDYTAMSTATFFPTS